MNNLLMKFVGLLAADEGGEQKEFWLKTIIDKIEGVIDSIIIPILILVATVGIVYSIVLGVNYAKAETSDQKEEAKKRIINVVVGALLMIVLMLLLFLFIKNADNIFGWAKETAGITGSGTDSKLFW